MDVLARFSRVWCPTCNKTQPMIFDVMKAKDNDAADIVCTFEQMLSSEVGRRDIQASAAMKLTKKQMLIRKAPATALNQTSATDEGIRVAKRRPKSIQS